MRQVKFIEDFEFNTTGGANGKTSMKEGEVGSFNDYLADKLVHHWQKAVYHDVRFSETKPMAPKEHKASYTLNDRGSGWYHLVDEDGDVVDKIRGEDKAKARLMELNK